MLAADFSAVNFNRSHSSGRCGENRVSFGGSARFCGWVHRGHFGEIFTAGDAEERRGFRIDQLVSMSIITIPNDPARCNGDGTDPS